MEWEETGQDSDGYGNHDIMQENANVDGRSPMGQMSRFASESSRHYALHYLMSPEIKKAVDDNFIYPHDLDYMPSGTTTCCQIPLGRLLKKGFHTGHGSLREPKDIMSAFEENQFDPKEIITHQLPLEEAGRAYHLFNDHEDDCIKVILKP